LLTQAQYGEKVEVIMKKFTKIVSLSLGFIIGNIILVKCFDLNLSTAVSTGIAEIVAVLASAFVFN